MIGRRETQFCRDVVNGTVWIEGKSGDFRAVRFDGKIVATGLYKETIISDVCKLAMDRANNILAIANIVDPTKRIKSNKPPAKKRPR